MSGDGGGPGAGRQGLAARLVAIPLRWLGLSAGAAGLAASGLFGGLEPVKEPAVPPATVGTVIEGEPWNVTISRARVVSELPRITPSKPGNRWFAVVATVEVTAPESRNDVQDVLDISGVDGLERDPRTKEPQLNRVLVLRDATTAGYLHPGVPETLAFLWEQAAAAPVPATVTITVNKKTHRASSLTGHMEWLDLEPRARLDVPVEDRREQK